MTKRIEVKRNLAGKTSVIGERMKEHFKLVDLPPLVYHEAEEWIEVPDIDGVEDFIATVDLRPVGSEWKVRARELLAKTKLTPKEDDELKLLHRKLFRETLGEGE